MPKRFNVGRTSPQGKQLANAVKRFNERVRYYRGKTDVLLPETVKVKDLRMGVANKREFNRVIKQLESFGRETVKPKVVNKENNIAITKWEYNKNRAELKRVNAERQKLLDKETPYTGTMGSVKRNNMEPVKDNINKLSEPWQVRSFLNKVSKLDDPAHREKRANAYKSQYLHNLSDYLGAEGEELAEILEKIPAEVMYDAYYEDPFLQAQFTSDPLSPNVIVSRLKVHWEDHLQKFYKDEKWVKEINLLGDD